MTQLYNKKDLQWVSRTCHIQKERKKEGEENIYICIYTAVKVYKVILIVTVNIIQTNSSLLDFVFFLQGLAETKGKPRKMTIHLNTWHGSVRIYGKLRFRLVIKWRIMSYQQATGYVNCACSPLINFHLTGIQESWHRIIQVRNSLKMYTMDNKSANHNPKTDKNRINGERFNCLLSTSSKCRINILVAFNKHDNLYRDKQR